MHRLIFRSLLTVTQNSEEKSQQVRMQRNFRHTKNPTGNKTRCKMEEMSNRRWRRNGRKKCRFWVSVSEFGQNVIDVCFASVTNWFLSRYEVEFGASAMYLWLIVPAISLCFLPFDFRHFYIHMCAQCRWERAEDQNRRCRCMQKFALICHIFWKSKRLNVLSRWWFHYSRFVCSNVLPGNKKPKYKAHTNTHIGWSKKMTMDKIDVQPEMCSSFSDVISNNDETVPMTNTERLMLHAQTSFSLYFPSLLCIRMMYYVRSFEKPLFVIYILIWFRNFMSNASHALSCSFTCQMQTRFFC